ncbi:hypothetical protein [Thauera sp.]|jgi:hypothetical protein|uniref:hypothetical protein n=1 Tax=Thauera sp. TaxID=1905334 RepID=UPI002A35AE41|nr:hypothetical protein [Thauera sp.]MDX9887055.1 hypothetical protein [Thauera sp.]
MMRTALPALTAAAMALGLSACALQPPTVATGGGISEQAGQFEFALPSGDYRCERGERLQLQREMANAVNHRIQLAWNGGQYQLERDPSYSGLPRFEDAASGLVWIDLPWKGLLLDGRTQKPLANECRAA